jgi:hypothetical protein
MAKLALRLDFVWYCKLTKGLMGVALVAFHALARMRRSSAAIKVCKTIGHFEAR